MKIEVTLEKKYFFVALGVAFVLFGIILVMAYNPSNSPVANPSVFGHSANEIEGLTSQSLSCVTVENSGTGSVIAACTSGFATGGGCLSGGGAGTVYHTDRPSGDNSWECKLAGSGAVTAYVKCCSVG